MRAGRWVVLGAIALSGLPVAALAQSDEIQVYDGALADKGKISLMLHSNFTPRGAKSAAFQGGVISDKAWVGTAEWALGVTDWFEQGLYLPLYSFSKDGGPKYPTAGVVTTSPLAVKISRTNASHGRFTATWFRSQE